MSLPDVLIHQFYDIAPSVIIISVCAGAVLLWRATRRVAALVQLASAVLMLVAWSLFELRIQTTGEFETTSYSLFLRAPWLRFAVDASMWSSIFVFSFAYFWYAITERKHLTNR
jgi:uncharacterized membrane protein YGL010W